MKRVFTSVLFLILCINFVNARPQSVERDQPTKDFEYDRIDEVKKECSSFFPPDSDHNPRRNRLYRLLENLQFVNGDWWQDSNKAPLIPYDNKTNAFMDQSSPLNLISFWITHVDRALGSKNSVSIHGVLQLGITMEESFTSKPSDQFPIFNMHPGHSELRMSFQGIIAGTQENNGENVMCLLGKAVLPPRHPDSNNQWAWIKEPGYISQPPFLQDDRILLVIHYPNTFTVTKRGIHGSLKSLNPKSSQKYFDEIHISSTLSRYSNYEFSSEKLVSKACTPYPYKAVANNDIGTYKGTDFCRILERFSGQDPLTIVPNWRCNGTDESCSKLGPFKSDTSNGNFKGVIVNLEDVRCEETEGAYGGFNRVALVIRVVLPSDAFYVTGSPRTGLNNMMLSAEGMWNSSRGQLCMVGCRGIVVEDGGDGCDSRICLYIPLSFSIKQRSIILGSISSIEESNTSYFPLKFEKRVRYGDLYNQQSKSRQYYNYTKIELARTIVEKHEPLRFTFKTVIKKLFLTFPKVNDAESTENSEVGLRLLAQDLTLLHWVVPESAPSRFPSQTEVQLEILSIDRLFGRYWALEDDTIIEEDSHLLLNVSAQLILTGAEIGNFSDLSVEGLYHPLAGKMYLIGCRDVRGSSNLLYENNDLEDGFDCRIEVVISYPPTTTFWLVSPTAKISIISQRNELDPLFFRLIELQTTRIMYRAQREGFSSRQRFEMMLQVLTPSLAIGCILSQLYYIKENLDSVPYISLVMLAIQAVGYGFPMVTGAGAPSEISESGIESYEIYKKNQMIQFVNYTVKIFIMISFLLTLRVYQRVWRSRIRFVLLRPHRVPSDRQVLLVTFFIYVLGLVCVLFVHKLQLWLVKPKEYLGLVQDLFLLPQVIGNLIWKIDCRPLRKSYFLGLTVIQLLPRVYDYIPSAIDHLSSEVVDPYSSDLTEIVFGEPYLDFYSKLGAIVVPTATILLAIAVHVQQKWSYEKLGRIFTFGKFCFYHVGPWVVGGGSGGLTEFQRQWRRCNEEEAEYCRRLN